MSDEGMHSALRSRQVSIPQSAPPLAAGVYPPREGGQFDKSGHFMNLVLEFDTLRFFDVCSPGHGVSFQKRGIVCVVSE